MSKLSNFKMKWPKSVEKLENGGRLGPLRQNLPPPPSGPLDPPVRTYYTLPLFTHVFTSIVAYLRFILIR